MKKRIITIINIKGKNKILTPEIKIKEIQVQINKTDCPRSGWITNNKINTDNKLKDTKWAKFKFLIQLDVRICAINKIKKGLINSTGWKRNMYKSSHLFAPFTSTPKNGTNINNNKKNKKAGNKLLLIRSVFNKDTKIIKKKDTRA